MFRTAEHRGLQPTVSSIEPLDFSPTLGLHFHLEYEPTRRLLVLWGRYMVLQT